MEIPRLRNQFQQAFRRGSVLGSLLFLIYINDISDDLTGLSRLFADGTSLSYSSADKHQIEIILNED